MSTAVKEIRFEERLDKELERLIGHAWKEEFAGVDDVTPDELLRWLRRRLNAWLQGQSNVPAALVDQQGLVDLSDVQQSIIRQWLLKASRTAPAPEAEPDLPPELGLDDQPSSPAPQQPRVAPAIGPELAEMIEETREGLALEIAGVGKLILQRLDANAAQAATAEGLAEVTGAVAVQAVELKALIGVIKVALEGLHGDVRILNAGAEAMQRAVANQGQELARLAMLVDSWSAPYVEDGGALAESDRESISSLAQSVRPSKPHRKKK